MKSCIFVSVSIVILTTISLSATSAEPGITTPQMKEFHFNRQPNYPNPAATQPSQSPSRDQERVFDDMGVDPADTSLIDEAFGKYRELIRKPGEEFKAATGKLSASLRQDAAPPESAKLLQQAVEAEQSLDQAKQKAFEEVTKEMSDRRRGQTFLYIKVMESYVPGGGPSATASGQGASNTEMPRPATGVRLRPATPSSPAQPPAAR